MKLSTRVFHQGGVRGHTRNRCRKLKRYVQSKLGRQ
jgi:hypothetical protein